MRRPLAVSLGLLLATTAFAKTEPLSRVNLGCALVCPAGGVDEGEPPLQDDAPLSFNCGCQCADPGLMSVLAGDADGNLIHCARNGWQTMGGSIRRDDDYLSALVGDAGTIRIEIDAEYPLYLFQMTTDCNGLSVLQSVVCGPCVPATIDIVGEPGELVWLFAAAVAFEPPADETPYEFDYTMTISGLLATVPTESANWGTVKTLFR